MPKRKFNYKRTKHPQTGYWHVEVYEDGYKELSQMYDWKPLVREIREKISEKMEIKEITLTPNHGQVLFFN